jgi:DNA-binding YbaB/EbfC family protein
MKMDKILKQAQKMQAQMARAQEELDKCVVEGVAGGGAVKVEAKGSGEILSVKISPEVVAENDAEMLEDLVLSAIKEAARLSHEMTEQKMGSVTGGFGGMPGFM